MSGYTVIDAARPPMYLPLDVDGVLGYIGGVATHVWSPAEWKPFAGVRQFPCWVAEGGAADTQAVAAVAAARRLGWAPDMPIGETRVIVIDMETAVEPAWYKIMAAGILSGGFVPVCYGSLSTVLGNAASDVLAADWDGIAEIPAGQTIHGVQYRANVSIGATVVDYSVFDGWLFGRGGRGLRHGA
jgi:hypothetical protein